MLIELKIRRKGGSRSLHEDKDANGNSVNKRNYHFAPQVDKDVDINHPDVYKNHPHVCEVTNKKDIQRFLSIPGYEIFGEVGHPSNVKAEEPVVEPKTEEQVVEEAAQEPTAEPVSEVVTTTHPVSHKRTRPRQE